MKFSRGFSRLSVDDRKRVEEGVRILLTLAPDVDQILRLVQEE